MIVYQKKPLLGLNVQLCLQATLKFRRFGVSIWCGYCGALINHLFYMIEELKRFVLSTLHFVYCDLCFYVIINPCVTLLYILCNGNTSHVCSSWCTCLCHSCEFFFTMLMVLIMLLIGWMFVLYETTNKLPLMVSVVFLVDFTIIWHLHTYQQVCV